MMCWSSLLFFSSSTRWDAALNPSAVAVCRERSTADQFYRANTPRSSTTNMKYIRSRSTAFSSWSERNQMSFNVHFINFLWIKDQYNFGFLRSLSKDEYGEEETGKLEHHSADSEPWGNVTGYSPLFVCQLKREHVIQVHKELTGLQLRSSHPPGSNQNSCKTISCR